MKIRYSLPAIMAGFILATGCAPMSGTSDEPTLEERIALQDRQLRQIQPQQADTWNEVQAMRQEIAELKGQLDDLKNVGGARALVSKVQQHDTALHKVNDNMALNLNLGEPLQQNQGMPITQNSVQVPQAAAPVQSQPIATHAPDSSAYGNAVPAAPIASAPLAGQQTNTVPSPVKPATPTQIMAPAEGSATGSYGLPPDNQALQAALMPSQSAAPSESTWGKADPAAQKPAAPIAKKDISLALFDAGVNAYNARKYNEAARSFQDFVKNYKNHTQTAEAQYYLSDCDFQRNKFNEAIVAYQTVIEKYPKSSSAPKAYLKQAICFGKIGNKAAARIRMQDLIKKYPKSPEVARAKNYLKTNK